MFKRVEDDVLLGVSKVISNKSQEKSNLLIDDEKILDQTKTDQVDNDESIDTSKQEEESYTLEDLIKITNENEDMIRSIIDKKDSIKVEKEKLTGGKDQGTDDSNPDTEENIHSEKSNDILYRDEYNDMKDELLSSLKDHIIYLKEQIDTKDKQLQNKDELIRNFQVLMKSDRDRIHELEASKVEDKNDELDPKDEARVDEEVKEANIESIKEDNIKTNNNSKAEINRRGFFNWFKK